MWFRECGSPGARWDLTIQKVIVCYEIIREFVQLHRNYGQAALVAGTPKMSKNKKIIMSAKSAGKPRTQKAFRSQPLAGPFGPASSHPVSS